MRETISAHCSSVSERSAKACGAPSPLRSGTLGPHLVEGAEDEIAGVLEKVVQLTHDHDGVPSARCGERAVEGTPGGRGAGHVLGTDPAALRNAPLLCPGLLVGAAEPLEPAQEERRVARPHGGERRAALKQAPEKVALGLLSVARLRVGIGGACLKPDADGREVVLGVKRTGHGGRPVEAPVSAQAFGHDEALHGHDAFVGGLGRDGARFGRGRTARQEKAFGHFAHVPAVPVKPGHEGRGRRGVDARDGAEPRGARVGGALVEVLGRLDAEGPERLGEVWREHVRELGVIS